MHVTQDTPHNSTGNNTGNDGDPNKRSLAKDLHILADNKLVYARPSPDIRILVSVPIIFVSVLFWGSSLFDATSLKQSLSTISISMLLLVYVVMGVYFLLGVRAYRLEFDRTNGTIMFDDMRTARISRFCKPIEDLKYIKFSPKAHFWMKAPELHFRDEVWYLCGGRPHKKGFTNKLSAETIRRIAEFAGVKVVDE